MQYNLIAYLIGDKGVLNSLSNGNLKSYQWATSNYDVSLICGLRMLRLLIM